MVGEHVFCSKLQLLWVSDVTRARHSICNPPGPVEKKKKSVTIFPHDVEYPNGSCYYINEYIKLPSDRYSIL